MNARVNPGVLNWSQQDGQPARNRQETEMTSTTDIATDETTTTEPVKLNGLDLASLTTADRKVLERMFGMALPSKGTVVIKVRKQAGGPCLCGCGEQTGSEFKAGHDARMKSVAKAVAAGETPKFPNHTGLVKASAKALLAERNW